MLVVVCIDKEGFSGVILPHLGLIDSGVLIEIEREIEKERMVFQAEEAASMGIAEF